MNRDPVETAPSYRRRGAMRVVMRHWVPLGAMAVMVALVLSACSYVEGLGDKTPACECPTLEATVASIDWTGDGREPDWTLIGEGAAELDRFPLRVKPFYEMSSPDEVNDLHAYIVAVMSNAGYEPAESDGSPGRNQKAEYRTPQWDMIVYSSSPSKTGDRVGETSIDLIVDEPDEKTPEYLAPLVDAFGTR